MTKQRYIISLLSCAYMRKHIDGGIGLKKKFFILDGSSLLYRAFYALPLLESKSGEFTNAIYGFSNMRGKRPSVMRCLLNIKVTENLRLLNF